MPRTLVALLSTMLATALPAQCGLPSGAPANGAAPGLMFDLRAQAFPGVEILGFDLPLAPGTWTVQVHAVSGGGSFLGNEQNPAAWTLLDSFSGVVGAGPGTRTVLPPLSGGGGPGGGLLISSAAVQGFYVTVAAQGADALLHAVPQSGSAFAGVTVTAGNQDLQLVSGSAAQFPFGSFSQPRNLSGRVRYGVPGQQQRFAINHPAAGMVVNGVQGDACTAALVTGSLVSCSPLVPFPVNATISTTAPGAAFVLGLSPQQPAAAGNGGALLPSGEILNLVPAGLQFLTGGLQPAPAPLGAGPLNLAAAFQVPLQMSVQAAVLAPGLPGGLAFSQPTHLSVGVGSPPPAVSGPTGDDVVFSFDPVTPPTCWLSQGWKLYGVTYTEMHVDSNGRLMGIYDDSDFSPSLGEMLQGPPALVLWADFSPPLGGFVQIVNPQPGIVRVDWQGVPYFGTPGSSNTFSLQYDGNTDILSIIGLSAGLTPSPPSIMFIGLTPGGPGGATNPGVVNGGLGFRVGAAGVGVTASSMLYDVYFQPAPGGLTLPLSINGLLNRVDFLPAPIAGAPGYAFCGT